MTGVMFQLVLLLHTRPGFLFAHSLMTQRIFSIFAFQLTSTSEAFKPGSVCSGSAS